MWYSREPNITIWSSYLEILISHRLHGHPCTTQLTSWLGLWHSPSFTHYVPNTSSMTASSFLDFIFSNDHCQLRNITNSLGGQLGLVLGNCTTAVCNIDLCSCRCTYRAYWPSSHCYRNNRTLLRLTIFNHHQCRPQCIEKTCIKNRIFSTSQIDYRVR